MSQTPSDLVPYKKLADYTHDELMWEINNKPANDEGHIAASQELQRRQLAGVHSLLEPLDSRLAKVHTLLEPLENRHQETLAHDRRLHKKTQMVAWIAVAVAAIGILVSILLYFHPIH
jgi:hypothetical protein